MPAELKCDISTRVGGLIDLPRVSRATRLAIDVCLVHAAFLGLSSRPGSWPPRPLHPEGQLGRGEAQEIDDPAGGHQVQGLLLLIPQAQV